MASPPEQKLHAVEARIEQATSEGGATPEQLVEWRQECLALAQLACRADTGTPDKYQLGRACANLATAYLATGATEAALRHAERAEALLLSQTGRPNSPSSSPGSTDEAQGGSQPRPASANWGGVVGHTGLVLLHIHFTSAVVHNPMANWKVCGRR